MAIKGLLREASLPDVLQLLALGKKSGCLSITHWNNFGYIYFDKGRISYASIVNRRDRIGELLLKAGSITMDQLQRAMDAQRTHRERRIGSILVELGYIAREELHEIVRVQIEEAVYLLFTWSDGAFNFEADLIPEDEDLLVSISTESLLLEGAQRIDEWSLIEQKIHHFGLVFDVDWRKLADTDLALTEQQRTVLHLLDGHRDVTAIIEAAGLAEFDVAKALYGLVMAGLALATGEDREPKVRVTTEERTEEHRNLGVAFYRDGRHEQALNAFRSVLDLDKNDTNARFYVGLVLLRQGKWAEAIEALQDAAGRPEARAAAIALERDIDVAQRHFEQALAVDPGGSAVHFHLGEIAYDHGLNEEARALLERAVELDAENHEALYLLGFVLGDLDRHDEARQATKRAIELNPALAGTRSNLATVEPRGRYVGKAERDSLRDVKMDVTPHAHPSHLNLGLAFAKRGSYEEAHEEYQLAIRFGEDRDLVEMAMAEVCLLSRDPGALHLYDSLLARHPMQSKLWNERGIVLHQSGRYVEARESYRRAIDCDPSCASALNNLGVALYHSGEHAAALDALQTALDARSGFVKAQLNQALLLYKGEQLPQALDGYRHVLGLASEHPVAWNGIGLLLADLKRFPEARSAFARAIQARPKYAEAHYNLSFTLSNLGDFDAALRETKLAIECDPYYVAQKFELAIDLQFETPDLSIQPDLGQETRADDAIEDFTFDPTALDTLFTELSAQSPQAPVAQAGDPFAEAHHALDQGLLDRAQAEAMRALARGGDRVLGGALLGDIFARQQLWGEALERYRDVRRESPDHLGAMLGEATALLPLGHAEEARQVAEEILPRMPDNVETLLLVAAARREAGDLTAAVAALETARYIAPARPDIYRHLGDIAQQLQDPGGAIAAYRSALQLDPGYALVRYQLASVLVELEAWDDAERELLLALDAVPSYAEATLALAQVRRRAGRPDDGLPLLIDLLKRDPYHFHALIALGETLLARGGRQDALEAFRRVLRFDPAHVGATYYEGVIFAEQERYDEAEDRFRRVVTLAPSSEYARQAQREIASVRDLGRRSIKQSAS